MSTFLRKLDREISDLARLREIALALGNLAGLVLEKLRHGVGNAPPGVSEGDPYSKVLAGERVSGFLMQRMRQRVDANELKLDFQSLRHTEVQTQIEHRLGLSVGTSSVDRLAQRLEVFAGMVDNRRAVESELLKGSNRLIQKLKGDLPTLIDTIDDECVTLYATHAHTHGGDAQLIPQGRRDFNLEPKDSIAIAVTQSSFYRVWCAWVLNEVATKVKEDMTQAADSLKKDLHEKKRKRAQIASAESTQQLLEILTGRAGLAEEGRTRSLLLTEGLIRT